MKLKLYCLSTLLFFATVNVFSQTGSPTLRFQSTAYLTSVNSVMIALRANENVTGQFSNLQFTFQIPSSVTPLPTLSIKSNPLSLYVPTAGYTIATTAETGFTTYSFNVVPTGSPLYSFVNGTQFDALEVKFSANSGPTNLRMSHLPNGGISTNEAFYVEINGRDNTNYPSLFYGTGVSNTPGYASYSFLPLTGLVLPVKIASFTATKKDNDALLTWAVENETAAVSNYEIERSIDGIKFEKINTIAKNTNASNIYNITDANLLAIKNNGIIYYRVKQMDVNGGFTYSEIRNVRTSEKGGLISAYPNPAKDFTTLRIDAETAGEISLALVNADGKQLYNSTMQAQKGINLQRINMSTFASGNYLLKATINGEIKTIAIVKL